MALPLRARVIYAFQGSEAGDLSFREDEIIQILEKDPSGWWHGQTDDGRRGDFPYNYVEIITIEEEMAIRQSKGLARNAGLQNSARVDKINKIKVVPKADTPRFAIEIVMSRKRAAYEKTIGEFRELDETLRLLFPNFDRPLPPMWADNLSLPADSRVNASRAKVLEYYLKNLLRIEAAEYALVSWLDPRTSFQVSDRNIVNQVINARAQVTGLGDNRNSVLGAMQRSYPLARARFLWRATDAVELSMMRHDLIAIRNRETPSQGWWEGETVDGQRGLFPANYVELLSPEDTRAVVMGEALRTQGTRNTGRTRGTQPGMSRPFEGSNGGQAIKKFGTTPAPKISARKRNVEEGFAMPSLDAFDELLIEGFTMLNKGSRSVFAPKPNHQSPADGDKVTLTYSAYVWDSQKQRLIEFAASDLHDENSSGGYLTFVLGNNETIKGLEKAVKNLEIGQESRVVVKPELGYGEVGNPPSVPPNCHLVYDIKLDNYEGATIPGPPGGAGGIQGYNTNGSNFNAGALGQSALADAIANQGVNKPGAWRSNSPVGPRAKRQPQSYGKPSIRVGDRHDAARNQPMVAPKKYPLHKIRQIVEDKSYNSYEVNPATVEDHLEASGFVEAFGLDRPAFLLLPKWKRNKLKKDAGLL